MLVKSILTSASTSCSFYSYIRNHLNHYTLSHHLSQCPRHQTGSAHIDKCSDAFRASLFIQQHTDEAQRQVFQDMPGYIPLTVDKHGCLRVPLYSIQEGANGIVPYTKMHHIPYEHDRAYVNEGDDEGDSNIINKEYQEDGSIL